VSSAVEVLAPDTAGAIAVAYPRPVGSLGFGLWWMVVPIRLRCVVCPRWCGFGFGVWVVFPYRGCVGVIVAIANHIRGRRIGVGGCDCVGDERRHLLAIHGAFQ
jgi:hypothetical protein